MHPKSHQGVHVRLDSLCAHSPLFISRVSYLYLMGFSHEILLGINGFLFK